MWKKNVFMFLLKMFLKYLDNFSAKSQESLLVNNLQFMEPRCPLLEIILSLLN